MTDPRSKYMCEYCFDRKIWKDFKEDKIISCPFCQKPEPKPAKKGRHKGHWDDTWMDLALSMASKSTCSQENREVGCIIVPVSNEYVLGIGYNGGAKGDANECTVLDVSAVGNSKCSCIHAEMNALAKMNPIDKSEKKMYLTLSPCGLCWKLIWNAGIKELIYHTEYERDKDPLEQLRKRGVKVRKYEDRRRQE